MRPAQAKLLLDFAGGKREFVHGEVGGRFEEAVFGTFDAPEVRTKDQRGTGKSGWII
jgi:hypothetical protein